MKCSFFSLHEDQFGPLTFVAVPPELVDDDLGLVAGPHPEEAVTAPSPALLDSNKGVCLLAHHQFAE